MTGGVVFILGAGASASAGAPVMKGFFQKAKHLKRKKRLDSYDNDFNTVENARAILRRAKIKSRLDVDNLEEIYTALEMVEIIGGIDGLTDKQAKIAQQSLDNLIAITLEQSIEFPVVHQNGDSPEVEPTTAYGELAVEAEAIRKLKDSRIPLTFLTFNYDIAFDFALFFANAKFSYCFGANESYQNHIKYCKLHGSLHWAFNKSTESLVSADLDFSALGRREVDLLEAEHICIKVDNDLWEEKLQGVIDFPFIIPPTGKKPYLQSLLKPIWTQAAKSLRSADLIIIIGYSFPATDPFFRNFFALSTIGSSDLEKILIVDPSNESYERLASIISPDIHSRIEHIQNTFDDSTSKIFGCLGEYIEEWW